MTKREAALNIDGLCDIYDYNKNRNYFAQFINNNEISILKII